MPAFEQFVAARGEALLRFALMLCGDLHRAEDLVQSVLAKAYVRWSRVAAMERPEAYLKAVLVSEHLRWWRRRSSGEVPVAGPVAGRPELAPAVRRRVASGRRRATWLAVGGLTAVVLFGAGLLVPGGAADRGGRDRPDPGPPAAAAPSRPAGAWRLESSLGVQIEVPAHWAVNDYGCQMSAAASVVRGQGAARLCRTEEPSRKQVAIFDDHAPPAEVRLAERQVTVDGVPGTRAGGRWPDGREAGWVWLPSRRVSVVVRTLDRATAEHILDSIRLVDVDYAGCPSRQPPIPSAPPGGRAGTLLPDRPAEISICYYLGDEVRLWSSTRLAGDSAAELAAAISAARPGGNPDLPGDKCARTSPEVPDLVLVAGRTRIWVRFTSCTARGLTDGVRWAQISRPLVDLMMKPLHAGYGYPQ